MWNCRWVIICFFLEKWPICLGFYKIPASVAVQYWWCGHFGGLTLTELPLAFMLKLGGGFNVFLFLPLPTWGNDQVGVNLRPRTWGNCCENLIGVRLVRLEKLIVKGEAQERRWRTPSGGNVGSLLLVCWPGSFGCNKKETLICCINLQTVLYTLSTAWTQW